MIRFISDGMYNPSRVSSPRRGSKQETYENIQKLLRNSLMTGQIAFLFRPSSYSAALDEEGGLGSKWAQNLA